jgi:hypothetical protein
VREDEGARTSAAELALRKGSSAVQCTTFWRLSSGCFACACRTIAHIRTSSAGKERRRGRPGHQVHPRTMRTLAAHPLWCADHEIYGS